MCPCFHAICLGGNGFAIAQTAAFGAVAYGVVWLYCAGEDYRIEAKRAKEARRRAQMKTTSVVQRM